MEQGNNGRNGGGKIRMEGNMNGMDNMENKDSDLMIERLRIFWESMLSVEKSIHAEQDTQHNDEKRLLNADANATPLEPMMEALPHLHFPVGVALDYFPIGDSMGTIPVLYVRNQDEPRHGCDNDFMLWGNQILRTGSGDGKDFTHFMEVVQPDPSIEGAWELLLLNLIGKQFGLHWHGRYHLLRVIYDWHDFFDKKSYFGKPLEREFRIADDKLSAEEKKDILSWESKPTAKVEDNKVTMRYCAFAPFAGFFYSESTVVFNPELRLMPAVILKKINYRCGIWY